MQNVNRYEVTCLGCGEKDVLTIDDIKHQVLLWAKMAATNFLSARFRGDKQWGFECKCGNDNRLARQEEKDMDKLVYGTPLSVKRIADSLKIPDKKQFRMVAV